MGTDGLRDGDGEHPTWSRLEDQLGWYDAKSQAAQRAFKRLKVGELVVASAIPVVALLDVPAVVPAVLGASIAVVEGILHLYQLQERWILYRSTAEALKHERFLYLAAAGPYTGEDRDRVLAEQVEGLVSQEHARWTSARQGEGGQRPGTVAPGTLSPQAP
jgi:hypothetical protein